MIRKINDFFVLDTKETTYCIRVMNTGHLEHLYYGRKITIADASDMEALVEQHAFAPGNMNVYDSENKEFSLEDISLEMSSFGKGDIREPFIEITHSDGSYTSDFIYKDYIVDKKSASEILPLSYDETNNTDELCIVLKDSQYPVELRLYYGVFETSNVITRRAVVINKGKDEIRLKRLLSTQLDFATADYTFTTFNGAWAREMKKNDIALVSGKYVNSSYTGTSSNRANPFVMLSNATEDSGDCYGFNLIYSGNHYEVAEVSSMGKLRFSSGINPQSFEFILNENESFEAPEAVMSYSHKGFNGMSNNMHRFVREHIVRGNWKKRTRPILLNSWEASYFDINERKLLNLAKAGRDAGIELFVMDDGWFGERDDDTKALGDWEPNPKKLPNGVAGLCKKINDLGLMFGIWVEPEMVNKNSRLYELHPDWVLQIPDKVHSEGRNQCILDLTKEEVQEFIIEKMSEVFSSANISYVKWDMNRTFTDYYSSGLPKERQGEVAHRYVLGLYRCMKELAKRFPDILFEGCASGGNRFDLGILCYFPQIWASDNTDALCRAEIQNGYSYGYPMSVVGAHVSSCPNHQTLRNTPLETRFNVAAFGVLGYECNFCDMKSEDLAAVKEQIALYKDWREVLQFGNFYRGRSFNSKGYSALENNDGNCMEWTCVSEDRSKAVGFVMQNLVTPNTQFHYYKPKGLDEDGKYHFCNRNLKYNIKDFGDLVNTVAPVHIKQDSFVHNTIARFVKMDGEIENYTAYGDALMYGGVKLKQSFSGNGYNDQVRYYQDFSSRIFFMEK